MSSTDGILSRDKGARDVKLNTHLPPVPRKRISGVGWFFPYTPRSEWPHLTSFTYSEIEETLR
jgi:hypothetical protein